MDSKVEDYKSLLLQQRGAGSIDVYRGSYRSQYGAGFGNVLRSIWRVAFPVLLRGAKTLITTGAEALKESDATPGSVFKAVLKPTVASLVDQTCQELAKVLSPTPPQTQTYYALPPRVFIAEQFSSRSAHFENGGGTPGNGSTTKYVIAL